MEKKEKITSEDVSRVYSPVAEVESIYRLETDVGNIFYLEVFTNDVCYLEYIFYDSALNDIVNGVVEDTDSDNPTDLDYLLYRLALKTNLIFTQISLLPFKKEGEGEKEGEITSVLSFRKKTERKWREKYGKGNEKEKKNEKILEENKMKENRKIETANFAVIFSYSFDSEVSVYLFENEEGAKKFLKESYEEEMRIDTEENGWDSYGYINKDGTFAKIETPFHDHTDKTEMRIGNIYQ